MYYISAINVLYSMTLCHYFLKKIYQILLDVPEAIEIYVFMKYCGWAFTLMGSLSIRCWKIDANRNFLLIWFCLFFFSNWYICLCLLFNLLFKKNKCDNFILFNDCESTWYWYSFTSEIRLCYSYTTQVLAFTSTYVAIFHKKI